MMKRYLPDVWDYMAEGVDVEVNTDSPLYKDLIKILKKGKKARTMWKAVHGQCFVNWFGNWRDGNDCSIVRYSTGEPRVVFHEKGRGLTFTDEGFILKSMNPSKEVGIYFTSDSYYAEKFDPDSYFGCFINLRNPEKIQVSDYQDQMGQDNPYMLSLTEDKIREMQSRGVDGMMTISELEEPDDRIPEEFVVILPEQVKSIENKGCFDPKSPNIYE